LPPKAADIVALYLNPPLNAVVLSVDEKPSIQAIERVSGYVETGSGKVVRALKSTYKRRDVISTTIPLTNETTTDWCDRHDDGELSALAGADGAARLRKMGRREERLIRCHSVVSDRRGGSHFLPESACDVGIGPFP
jgi:hypothetical protein